MNKHIPFRIITKINDGFGSYSEQDWSFWVDEPLHNGQLALLVLDGLLCALCLTHQDIIQSNDKAYDIANSLGRL